MDLKGLYWFLGILLVLNLVSLGFVYSANSNELSLTDQQVLTLGESITVSIDAPEVVVSENVSDNLFVVTKSEYEDDLTEQKALELAKESLLSRDGEKAVFDVLVDFGVDIDSYKDITRIKIVDSDVDVDEVSFDVKVYYFLDGDDEEAERARLEEFTVTIDDLDFDDDFEDAEVDESYLDALSVLRVYD